MTITDPSWLPTYSKGVTRRQFIAGAAGGTAAAVLIACGGGSSAPVTIAIDPSGVRKAGAVIYDKDTWMLADETKNAVPGGIYVDRIAQGLTESMDPFTATQGFGDELTEMGYEYLVTPTIGPGIDPSSREGQTVRGHLAEAYEISNDGLAYTFTLRRGVKFHPIAPVNGREMTIDDWKTTYDRHVETSSNRVAWTDVVERAEYPDARHMVLRLKEPYAPFLKRMWDYNFGFKIVPKELNANSDLLARNMIGTNFRMLDKINASVDWQLKRFDDYWQGKPFIDRWHFPIIPETANVYAQFVAQNIVQYSAAPREALNLRKDSPTALMVASRISPTDVASRILFGLQEASTSPWKDPRVRIGMHKLMPWDNLAELVSNKEAFRAAGIEVEIGYQTHVPYDLAYWLDPRKGELGAASSNYAYDVAEAKRLITAAGFADGFDFPYYTNSTTNETIRVHIDELKKSGIVRPDVQLLTAQEFSDKVTNRGEFKGVKAPSGYGEGVDVDYLLSRNYYSKGQVTAYPDPKIDDLVKKERQEADPIRRAEHLKEFQRYVATTFYALPGNHRTTTWSFEQPWLHNVNHQPTSRLWKLSYLNWLDAGMPRRNG